jgi:hypothetical protein
MNMSDTVVAAIIAAIATISTALAQLIRNHANQETRPKKSRTRGLFATIALMLGCVVGGYAWSSYRAASAREELEATMEAQFNKRFGAAMLAQQAQLAPAGSGTAPTPVAEGATALAPSGQGSSSETVAHLPPCKINPQPDEIGPVTCTERVAQSVSLCASIPSAAQATNVRVQARIPKSESPWLERDAGAPTLGNLHIAAQPAEYPVSADQRSVCLDVSNRSVEDTLAVRVIVEYAFGPPPAQELTAAAPSAHTL